MEISRSAVARIRTEKEERKRQSGLPSKNELMDMAKVAEAIDEDNFDVRQLQFNFERDPVLKEKSEEFDKETSPKGETDTEKHLIKRLQQGERCSFSGGLMHPR